MKGKIGSQFSIIAILVTVFCLTAQRSWAVPAATTTTLAVSSGGNAVTTVKSGSVITLTATVNTGTAAVTTGQVKFCDASAAYCSDIHLFGNGQLTKAGTAILRFVPGIGSHSFKAIFVGTAAAATSSSASATLSVTGLYPTATTLSQSGSSGSYALTATVVGSVGTSSPTGTVSIVDTSNGNAVLGTGELGASTTNLSFLNPANPAAGSAPVAGCSRRLQQRRHPRSGFCEQGKWHCYDPPGQRGWNILAGGPQSDKRG